MADNGIGIKKDNQDKLFKLFGSIKDNKKKLNTNGIGLGLVISKLIVEKFGGYIDFISKLTYHSNSCFPISLVIDNIVDIHIQNKLFMNNFFKANIMCNKRIYETNFIKLFLKV